jgi:glycosyltransferase involved in cell wall biosynthesis
LTPRPGGAPVTVTFVALNYAPSVGGAQELVRRIAEGLVARGVVVEVLTSDALRSPTSRDPGRIDVADEEIAGVRVRRFASSRPVVDASRAVRVLRGRLRRAVGRTGGSPPALAGPWSFGLARAVRAAARRSDVVVGCSAPFSTLLLPPWLGRGRRATIVSMPLLHRPPGGLHHRLQAALRRSDRVVAMTTHEAGLLAEIGVPADRVQVIPPGTDVDGPEELTPSAARQRVGLPDRPTVGFIGRLAAYKGIDTLLDAAPAIWAAQPDATIMVAGGAAGWDPAGAKEAEALGGDRLVIREGFPHHERDALMQACDVIVHPSRHESFGMIAIEAWAVQRPVVLADIACVGSFVEAGRTGELIPPGDADALARCVIDLMADPQRRRELAAAGRAEAVRAYDWERICDQWLDLVTAREGRR